MKYWVVIGDESSGPFSVEEIEGMLKEGRIEASTQVMPEVGSEWRALGEVFDLGGAAAPAPPVPPSPPAARPVPTMRGAMPVGATQPGTPGQHTVSVSQPSSATPVLVIFAVILVVAGGAGLFIHQRNQRVKAESDAAKAKYDAAIAQVEAAKAAQAKPPAEEFEITATGELQPALTIVDGQQTRFSKLMVTVGIQGGVAAEAYAIGPVTAEPLKVGEAALNMQDAGTDGFEWIDRSGSGFGPAHPQGGFAIAIDFGQAPESTTRTGPLKGSVSVMAGGTEKMVLLSDLTGRETGAIVDPALEAAGMTALFKRNDDEGEVEVAVELGKESARLVSGLDLVDASGQPVESSAGIERMPNGVIFSRTAPASSLDGAVLRLRFRDGATMEEIPFTAKGVDVEKS